MSTPETLFGIQVWTAGQGWLDIGERYTSRSDAQDAMKRFTPGSAAMTMPGRVNGELA
jgi:hypothetical protein